MDRTRISSKGQIVIPKPIRERHRWKPGTELAVIDAGGGVRIEALQRGKTRVVITPVEDSTLKQRLAAYDSKRHGGEQMAKTQTLGAERG